MKRQLLRILLAVIALSMGIWFMSCSPTQQNTNQSTNSANQAGIDAKPDCSSKDKIERIMDKVIADSGLTQHRDVNVNINVNTGAKPDKMLKYRVIQDTNQWVVVIEGKVSDGKKGKNDENSEFLELFVKAIDQMVTKECAVKVVFVKSGTLREAVDDKALLRNAEGFEWSSCEWPNIACPGGVCKESCDSMPIPEGTPPATNTNANANGNVNPNTNSNRP